jgi:regulator of sigma E protease
MSAPLLHFLFSAGHSFLANLWFVFLVILFFAGSIFVHELGHFLAARRRGVRVERFSIGIGPVLWSRRGRDGVEYCLCLLPLGGYVLLPQLADLSAIEGRSTVDAARLPPVSYASKMIVFAAGALFNILFAFALACVLWVIGQPESADIATTRIGWVAAQLDLPDGSHVPSPAAVAGLRVGDVVRAIDGHPVNDWNEMLQTLITSSGRGEQGQPRAVFTVERDGRRLDIPVLPRLAGDDHFRKVGISQDCEWTVDEATPGSPAAKAGFQAGDTILSLDGVAIRNVNVYMDYLESSQGKAITARVRRDGRELTLAIPARAPSKIAGIGLTITPAVRIVHLSPFAQVNDQLTATFRILGSLLNPRSDLGLSNAGTGPIGIVRYFHSAAESGLATLLMFTLVVNVSLAIFNLLPIPVLDGGHMLFATIGRLRGRALPLNFVLTTQSLFLALLAVMVVYLSVFDIRRWQHEAEADRAAAVAEKP